MSIYSTKHNLDVFEDHNTSLYKISQLIDHQSTSILDVGCSSGYLGQYIKLHSKNKITIDGIEIDAHDRLLAQKHLDSVKNIDIQKSDEINNIDKSYQTIIFADVLEHTINPKKILGNFVKKLTPNGQVLLSIPNITHQSIILELLSGQWNYENSGLLDKTHLHFFDYNEVIRLVEQNGLFINKIDYSIFDLPTQKITKTINKIGLKNPDELIKILKKPQHKIFQFVISASNKKPLQYKSYINDKQVIKPVSDWINEWEIIWNKYNEIVNSPVNIRYKITTKKIKHYQQKYKILSDKYQKLFLELKEIKDSKFFKFYPHYEKVKSMIKHITNNHENK